MESDNPSAQSFVFPPTAEVPSDAALIRALGREFLAYVCAATEEEIAARADGTPLPSPAQEHAFVEVLQVAGHLAAHRRPMMLNNEPALEPLTDAFARFGHIMPGQEVGLANAFRVAAGGALSDAARDDPLKAAACAMARDWFPVALIPDDPDTAFRFTGWVFRTVDGHPGMPAFISAVNDESEPLRSLFDVESLDAYTPSRAFMSGSGMGGHVQPALLAATLLANAEQRAAMKGNTGIDEFIAGVEEQIDELRKLAVGETVRVLAAVGLGPAQVDDDFDLVTPWGRVVAATALHRRYAPPQVSASLVLLTEFDLHLDFDRDLTPGVYEGPTSRYLAAHSDLEHRIDLVRLMFTLGLNTDPPVAVAATWRLIADPSRNSGFSWSTESPVPQVAQITRAAEPELRMWADRIRDHDHPSLALAIRRTLRSIASRYDPADGLVDAVIALESLFGSGNNEVSFRLSAAIAWLLEATGPDRLERQKAVADLYGRRSKIVHGSHIEVAQLYPHRVEASKLAVESLRKLFADWPDLIRAGDQRGKLLILQAHTGTDGGEASS